MGQKLGLVICLLILTTKATHVALGVDACNNNNEDCPEGYYCDGDTCKKCLSCSLIFRTGGTCIKNFNECEDCLAGYEEISITVNSHIKKPCKLIKKNLTECSTPKKVQSCPPNNYCSNGACIKCFDCALMNRLPPANNCAKSLTECGTCKFGFEKVSVTTLTNFKPCEIGDDGLFKRFDMEFSNYFLLIVLPVLSFFISIVILIALKLYKDRSLSKSISLCTIYPSAPPLVIEDLKSEESLRRERLNSENKRMEFFGMSYVREQMQMAKVFQQPSAAYYIPDEEIPSEEQTLENQWYESQVQTSWGLQFGNNALIPQQYNEIGYINEDSASLGIVEETSSNVTGMGSVELGSGDPEVMSATQQSNETRSANEVVNDSDSTTANLVESEQVKENTGKKI